MKQENVLTFSTRPNSKRYFHIKSFRTTMEISEPDEANQVIEMGGTEITELDYKLIKSAYKRNKLSEVTALLSKSEEKLLVNQSN